MEEGIGMTVEFKNEIWSYIRRREIFPVYWSIQSMNDDPSDLQAYNKLFNEVIVHTTDFILGAPRLSIVCRRVCILMDLKWGSLLTEPSCT